MRVNSRVFTERTDLMGTIQIPNCPPQFRKIAENLVMLASKPGYSVGTYNSVTELDKMLMFDYWWEYDGLEKERYDFGRDWFIHKATPPELIRRSREWLAQKNYIILKEDVQHRALQAGERMRHAISNKQ